MSGTVQYRAVVPGSSVMVQTSGVDYEIGAARDRRYAVENYPAWRSFLIEHPDGIFIDLPMLDYLNDWALSYSAFKTLNSSPPDWWWESVFNILEDKVQRSTPALRFGSALHCGLLEPEGELERRFGIKPSEDDPQYKDYARTIPEIKKAIEDLGNKPKSGLKKEELIRYLLELDPNAKILDIAIDEWKRRGMTELTAEQFQKLRLMMRMAQQHPHLKNAFTGVGLSEVSVFWTDENQVRQRARFDRMKPMASIDLKSLSNWAGREFRTALLREAALRQYHMQAVHYDVARQEARRLLAEGKVYFCAEVLLTDAEIADVNAERIAEGEEDNLLEPGAKRTVFRSPTEEELALVQQVMGGEQWEWVWVFYKTDGAPTAQPVRLDRETMPFRVGHENRDKALASFMHYREMFQLEPGQMWLRLEPMFTPDDGHWPAFMDPNVS